jgi:hypothetical protein
VGMESRRAFVTNVYQLIFSKNCFFIFVFFLLKNNFFYILNCFDVMILKNKKYIILIYFHIKITLKNIYYR